MSAPTDSKTWIRNEELLLAAEFAEKNLAIANRQESDIQVPQTFYTRYGKRLLDIVISGTALIVTAPINAMLAAGTFIDVGSPIIFRQQRCGKDMVPFEIIKFRNMTNERDESGELLPPSQRVTAFGRFVRKTSLDELLNFWSVLKGDMSIIGPRPLPVEYMERFSNRHKARYLVRPGLECPIIPEMARKYPFPEPYSRYQAQFESDVWYVEHISLGTDIAMFARLVKRVFERKQRSVAAGAAASFIGYDSEGIATSTKHYSRIEHEKEMACSAPEQVIG